MISNCRCQKEVELRLLEEETAKRVEQAIRRKVEETLNCEEMKQEIQRRIEEGRKRIQVEVAAQIEKQKEAALIEAKEKAVSFSLEQSLPF
jgi:arginine and glutamate-rich protein 1